jgi:hypothetical protein
VPLQRRHAGAESRAVSGRRPRFVRYIGAGFTFTSATAEVVIAYERPMNHGNVRLPLHVLYGDGRVERVSKPELERRIMSRTSGRGIDISGTTGAGRSGIR